MNNIESEMARCDQYTFQLAVKTDLATFLAKCPNCQMTSVGV